MTPLTGRVKIIDDKLHVEDCDGTWREYPIPCTCGDDSQIPDPPLETGATNCRIAYGVENFLYLALQDLQEIMDDWDDGTGSEYQKFVGLTRWIAHQKLPLNMYNNLYSFWNTYRPDLSAHIDATYHDADSAYVQSVCACNNSLDTYLEINDQWKSFWAAQLTTFDDVPGVIDATGWQLWHDFIVLIPIGWLKDWVVSNLANSAISAFPDDCSGCDGPGEPQDCYSNHVVFIPEWQGVATPAGWAVDNVTVFADYGDFMDGPVFDNTWYPSAGRLGVSHWTTLPTEVTNTNHPGMALIYDPGEPICVFKIGFRARTGTGNTKRLGVYGLVGSSWVQLSYSHYGLDTSGSEVTTDSGHINVTNITKLAFLFLSGGGHPEIEGVWINHAQA